jgi:hypothetical protein
VDQLVRELRHEGLTDIWAMMINNPLGRGQGYRLEEVNAQIPALQDTFTTIYGGYTPAVGALLGCLEGDELLIVDREGHLSLKVRAGEGGYDLREAGARSVVKDWLRHAVAECGCADCETQFTALTALRAECEAAGVTPLTIVAVNPQQEGCLGPSVLRRLDSPDPVLQDDRSAHLAVTIHAAGGELMLLDDAGRIHRRIRAGGCADQEVNLTLPEDRAQVIEWLQGIEPTRAVGVP